MEIEENHNHNSMRGALVNQEENSSIQSWHNPSSRIYRVSRATGGKDRHSKVYTSKGLRDRRIRLSVPTAIQFYDLQDRLGYDQPSKAIEWLIKAAQSAINELPPLDISNFMDREVEHSHNNNNNQQQQTSSASETSKGSVLSFSKEKDKGSDNVHKNTEVGPSLNPQGSFTKLLTGRSSVISPVGIVPVIDGGDHRFTSLQNHFYRGDYDLNLSILPISGFHRETLQSNLPSHHQNRSHDYNQYHHQYLQSNAQRLSLTLDGSSMAIPVPVPMPVPFFFGTALSGASSSSENLFGSEIDGHMQHFDISGKGKC